MPSRLYSNNKNVSSCGMEMTSKLKRRNVAVSASKSKRKVLYRLNAA
jgi:hypothetical protein